MVRNKLGSATRSHQDLAFESEVLKLDNLELSNKVATLQAELADLNEALTGHYGTGGGDPLHRRGSMVGLGTLTGINDDQKRRLVASRLVIEAYDIVLHRLPDPAGLKHFCGALLDGVATQYDIILGLYKSEEGRSRPVDPTDFVAESDRMAALSGLFESARTGTLLQQYADGNGDCYVGYLAEKLLGEDLGSALVYYVDYCLREHFIAGTCTNILVGNAQDPSPDGT